MKIAPKYLLHLLRPDSNLYYHKRDLGLNIKLCLDFRIIEQEKLSNVLVEVLTRKKSPAMDPYANRNIHGKRSEAYGFLLVNAYLFIFLNFQPSCR